MNDVHLRPGCSGSRAGTFGSFPDSFDGMSHDFDHIAKRLWFMEADAVRLVASLPEKDRHSIERSLFSLYGATLHLTGTEGDIRTVLEKVRR